MTQAANDPRHQAVHHASQAIHHWNEASRLCGVHTAPLRAMALVYARAAAAEAINDEKAGAGLVKRMALRAGEDELLELVEAIAGEVFDRVLGTEGER